MGGESDNNSSSSSNNNNSIAFGVAAQYAKSFLVSLIPTHKKPCCNRLDHSQSYHHHHHHHHARTSSSSLSSPSSSPSSLSSSSSFSSLGGVNMLDYNDSQLGVPNHPPSPSPSYFSIRKLKSRLSSSSSMNSTTTTTTTTTTSTRDALPTTPSHHYLKSAKKLKSRVWDAIKANSKGKQREVPTTTTTTTTTTCTVAALTAPSHEVQTQLVVTALEVAQPPSPSPLSRVEDDDHKQPYYCASQQVEFHNDYYSSLNEDDFKTAVDDFIERFNQHVAQEEHAFLYS